MNLSIYSPGSFILPVFHTHDFDSFSHFCQLITFRNSTSISYNCFFLSLSCLCLILFPSCTYNFTFSKLRHAPAYTHTHFPLSLQHCPLSRHLSPAVMAAVANSYNTSAQTLNDSRRNHQGEKSADIDRSRNGGASANFFKSRIGSQSSSLSHR